MRSARVRRRRLTAAAVGVALVLALPAASRAVADRHADPSSTYVVRPGDTLWAIAVRLSPGSDPRPVIDLIVRTNGIDAANLVPGQQLRLPE